MGASRTHKPRGCDYGSIDCEPGDGVPGGPRNGLPPERQQARICRGDRMKPNHKLSRTIAAILSASAAHAILAADAGAASTAATAASTDATAAATSAAPTTSAGPDTLQTVIVTAQRREQNIQDVPITIQAMTGKTLQSLNVQTFADYVKYLPNVSTGSQGPGMGTLFMRGLSTG